jgi:hypothetical protein
MFKRKMKLPHQLERIFFCKPASNEWPRCSPDFIPGGTAVNNEWQVFCPISFQT